MRRHRWVVDRVAPVGLLLAVFVLVQRWAVTALHLPEDAYRSSTLSLELIRLLVLDPRGWLALVPLLAVTAWRWREITARWDEPRIRWLVSLLAGWATWAAVTLDHNLFFDRSYDADRLVLSVLTGLIVWRPIFVLPHVFLFVALEHQYDHPFGRQIFARAILEHLLILFASALIARALLRRSEWRSFAFTAVCLLAAFYWYPGYVKAARGWLSHGQLYLGGFASYANGWLAGLTPEQIVGWLKIGEALDVPGRALTLVSELAAPLVLLHRRVSRTLLVAWVLLHLGIWAFSGVSFLVWIAVDLAFLAFLFGRSRPALVPTGGRAALGAAVLIIGAPLWLRVPPVGWFDTPLVYTYRYEATDEDGRRAAFPADATPLGEAWCARDFEFLSPHETLAVRYGKTNDRDLARTVATIDGLDRLTDLERERGRRVRDQARARDFDRYLRTIVENWNRGKTSSHPLSRAAPPRTCLSPREAAETPIETGRRIERLDVLQLTFLFDGAEFREIRRVRVRTIQGFP